MVINNLAILKEVDLSNLLKKGLNRKNQAT